MPMLAFLPWRRLREAVSIGDVVLFPIRRYGPWPQERQLQVAESTVTAIMAQHYESANIPIRAATLIQFRGQPIGEEFCDDDATVRPKSLAVPQITAQNEIDGFRVMARRKPQRYL